MSVLFLLSKHYAYEVVLKHKIYEFIEFKSQNSQRSSFILVNWKQFNNFMPFLNGVRMISVTGGIRASVNGAGVKKGPGDIKADKNI